MIQESCRSAQREQLHASALHALERYLALHAPEEQQAGCSPETPKSGISPISMLKKRSRLVHKKQLQAIAFHTPEQHEQLHTEAFNSAEQQPLGSQEHLRAIALHSPEQHLNMDTAAGKSSPCSRQQPLVNSPGRAASCSSPCSRTEAVCSSV